MDNTETLAKDEDKQNRCECRCSRRVSRSCFLQDTHHVTHIVKTCQQYARAASSKQEEKKLQNVYCFVQTFNEIIEHKPLAKILYMITSLTKPSHILWQLGVREYCLMLPKYWHFAGIIPTRLSIKNSIDKLNLIIFYVSVSRQVYIHLRCLRCTTSFKMWLFADCERPIKYTTHTGHGT